MTKIKCSLKVASLIVAFVTLFAIPTFAQTIQVQSSNQPTAQQTSNNGDDDVYNAGKPVQKNKQDSTVVKKNSGQGWKTAEVIATTLILTAAQVYTNGQYRQGYNGQQQFPNNSYQGNGGLKYNGAQ